MKQKFKELLYLDFITKSYPCCLNAKSPVLLGYVGVGLLFTGLFAACGSLSYSSSEPVSGNYQRVQALAKEVEKDYPVAQISPEELRKLVAKNRVVIVDSRSNKERNVSMLPNAISIDDFKRLESLGQGKQVVVYCTIGVRSSEFVQALSALDIEARNLYGGLLNWIHSGGSLVDSRGNKTHNVHVYGRKWRLLPIGYLSQM